MSANKVCLHSVCVLQCVGRLGWKRCGNLLCLAQKQEVVLLFKPVWIGGASGIKTCCVLASLQKAQQEQTMIAQFLREEKKKSLLEASRNIPAASLIKILTDENFP